MTFISTADVWVEAYMRENSISNIRPGNPVEILLDVASGRVFRGEVASVGFAVRWNTTDDASGYRLCDWRLWPVPYPVAKTV